MSKPEAITPEKMELTSMNVAEEKREELKRCLGQAFPEVFAEGSIDFDQLKRVLGEWVDPGKERFGLNWPGKAECMKIIQQPSVATLKPAREESVNFDETENLFIEGDNLEVLKLLQKPYFGKIKMIYIDPPYNTGKEFIYPDKYAETLETYLAYTGQPETIWFGEDVGTTREAATEIKNLFDGKAPFDTVKPTRLIERMLQIAGVGPGDLCLDFFAGSCSTGHALYKRNHGGRFIVVQLPERIDQDTPHGKAATELGFSNVAQIGRERLRRAAKAEREQHSNLELGRNPTRDFGFRAFKLDQSNFRVWNPVVEGDEELGVQLAMHVDHISKESTPDDIVYELLLKSGFPLITKVTVVQMAGKQVLSIQDGALLICLDKEITPQRLDAMAEANPLQVICLDEGFKGNDQLKANAVQTFKARAEAEESEIVFKTV